MVTVKSHLGTMLILFYKFLWIETSSLGTTVGIVYFMMGERK